ASPYARVSSFCGRRARCVSAHRSPGGIAASGGGVLMLRPRPDLWSLDPEVLYLNHGSYGAVPRRTQQVAARLRAETEANPMAWFRRLPERLAASRRALGDYLGAEPDGFALVPNASAGVLVALSCIPIAPGERIVITDHAHRAGRHAAE